MTYAAREASQQSGQPVEVYDIALGSQSWHLTDAEGDFVLGANIYQAVPVTRTEITLGREGEAESITVSLPSDHPFPALYKAGMPDGRATVTVRRYHRSDTEVVTIYDGVVNGCRFVQDGSAVEVQVAPISQAIDREVPRHAYSAQCNHALYDSRCTIASGAFKYTSTVGTVGSGGKVLTVTGLLASKGANWAKAGFCVVGGDRRLILEQSGDDIRLYMPFGTSPLGSSIDVFAGCDHTLATCNTKFGNKDNFGGHAFVPLRNVFEGGLD